MPWLVGRGKGEDPGSCTGPRRVCGTPRRSLGLCDPLSSAQRAAEPWWGPCRWGAPRQGSGRRTPPFRQALREERAGCAGVWDAGGTCWDLGASPDPHLGLRRARPPEGAFVPGPRRSHLLAAAGSRRVLRGSRRPRLNKAPSGERESASPARCLLRERPLLARTGLGAGVSREGWELHPGGAPCQG